MLIDEFVEVNVHTTNYKRYQSLGYEIPKKENGKIDIGHPIKVSVNDLSKGSNVIVNVLCDFCKSNTISMPYYRYIKLMKKNGGIRCKDCKYEYIVNKALNRTPEEKARIREKTEQTNLERFGVTIPIRNKEVQQKMKDTVLERYGVEYISQSKEIVEKAQKTKLEKYGTLNPWEMPNFRESYVQKSLKRFGTEYPSQSKEIRDKIKETTLKHFDVPFVLQSPIVKQKSRTTNMQKYGVEYPSQSPIIKQKIMESFYNNSSMKASKQQLSIFSTFLKSEDCKLNYPISNFYGDIVFLDDMIDFEIDYNGHWYRVITGQLSEDEFKVEELKREKVIKSQGYKIVRLISRNSRNIPSESKLLEILSYTREYFSQYPQHTWIEWNIDNSTRRDAEHMDGIFFDFGKLQKVDNNDLKTKGVL